MTQQVLDIVDKNFIKVDVLTGVRRILDICCKKDIECFVVYDNEILTGVVTKRQLIGAHPNRIIADVMSYKYICINISSHLWQVREVFDLNEDIEIVLVEDGNEIIGYITRTTLNIELGKHIDLLTGLYKSDYIFYNAYKLIKNKENMTIIFMDLNNFGHIDKKYGHINGDAILKNVAKVLKKSITSDSYLCRYAGDEFTILTPYCIDKSKLMAEKIIKAINLYEFPNNIPVSASIGITGCGLYHGNIENISELINKLVNIASLASTKAKQSSNSSIIIEELNIDAIA